LGDRAVAGLLVGYRRLQVGTPRSCSGFLHLACALIGLKSPNQPKIRNALHEPQG
jgi:hypothetical protein